MKVAVGNSVVEDVGPPPRKHTDTGRHQHPLVALIIGQQLLHKVVGNLQIRHALLIVSGPALVVKPGNYKFVNSRDALNNIDLTQFGVGGKKLLGLFNASHVNYEQDRQLSAPWEPSLAEMTQIAIKVLTAKSNGKCFFLLVESGRIDHLEHSNTGGISVVAGTGTGTTNPNQYAIDADLPVYVGGGDAGPGATPTTARRTEVYASDYMIRAVSKLVYSLNRSTADHRGLF